MKICEEYYEKIVIHFAQIPIIFKIKMANQIFFVKIISSCPSHFDGKNSWQTAPNIQP